MEIIQFICRHDNFGILIHDKASGLTAAIDAPDAAVIQDQLQRHNWTLDFIFVTHHHNDHVEGIHKLKEIYDAKVIGPKAEEQKIQGIDIGIDEGEPLDFGAQEIKIIATPGHTLGGVSYYFPFAKVVFTGDTLFSLGCGRIFEGNPSMMFQSLNKLKNLPDDTKIYCGHEYTLENAHFALTIDPNNQELINRKAAVERLIAVGEATLPTTLALEKATNPFLRYDDVDIRQNLAMENADDAELFAEIRKRKDKF
ncbi:hydroxyacylglutathione hydrolase [Bartonella tamiae]|uniref:Hydroxyacylglutathione hydrolase n=1 Tax=Bartonella tamiae Th239 TaxID=1094558 RepID=J1K0N7_9HYPH|nr:hydroxyacylglutathione hydrolase [Bartonella tamiae]EJF90972.1 hydroxyacylglutathione hydrolase [Bartonella tamiae Th239]EJF93363.1 hydroxyacylglutathione hydrolase [Bartonella tamiae Th307]